MQRVVRRFVITLVFAVLMVAALVSDIIFSLHAKSGQAVVVESHSGGRSAGRVATVRFTDGEQERDGTLRTWIARLTPGEEVPIVYVPGEPENVVLDRYFERHRLSLLALVVLAIATVSEVETMKGWMRRQDSPLTRE